MIRSFAFCVVVVGVVIGSASCSSPAPPTARTIIDAQVEPGASMTACGISPSEWVQIGGFGSVDGTIPVLTVDNGGAFGGGSVSIACSVKGTDTSGYVVAASATLTGTQGGTVSVTGTFFPPTGTPPADQTGITGVFERSDYGRFSESDCTVSYAANKNMGVAPGRVWGTITCPTIVNSSQADRTCETTAQFRFENCDQ